MNVTEVFEQDRSTTSNNAHLETSRKAKAVPFLRGGRKRGRVMPLGTCSWSGGERVLSLGPLGVVVQGLCRDARGGRGSAVTWCGKTAGGGEEAFPVRPRAGGGYVVCPHLLSRKAKGDQKGRRLTGWILGSPRPRVRKLAKPSFSRRPRQGDIGRNYTPLRLRRAESLLLWVPVL